MKRILPIVVLILAAVLAVQVDAYGQRGKKKKSDVDEYFDESGNFSARLWYGGGLVLGFSGNNLESIFQLGISPMVGYKITDEWSVGPRLSLLYTLYRAETFTPAGVESTSFVNYGMGAFTRYKIFRALFIHLEYGFDNQVRTLSYDPGENRWNTNRSLVNNAYIGGGFNDGNGIWGYEIALLYNVLDDGSTVNLPLDFRFGVTYNF